MRWNGLDLISSTMPQIVVIKSKNVKSCPMLPFRFRLNCIWYLCNSAICTVSLIFEIFRPSQYLLSRADFETVLHYKFNAHKSQAVPYTSSFIRLFTVKIEDWRGWNWQWILYELMRCDSMQTYQMLLWKTKWYYT